MWYLIESIPDLCPLTYFNLHKEVDRGKLGQKAASAKFGLNVALTQLPIGPNSIRRLCLGSNIPASSAGKPCKEIERINKIGMKSQRNVVKTVNRIRDMPENEITVQADGIYNNSLFSGVGKTLYQPATQCSYNGAEYVTPKNRSSRLKMLTNFALSLDFIPLRMASAILCLVAVLQQLQ